MPLERSLVVDCGIGIKPSFMDDILVGRSKIYFMFICFKCFI